MDRLKPCPFCGGEAVLIPHSGCSGSIMCVGDCGFESAKYWDEPMTEPKEKRGKWHEKVAEKWNMRVAE